MEDANLPESMVENMLQIRKTQPNVYYRMTFDPNVLNDLLKCYFLPGPRSNLQYSAVTVFNLTDFILSMFDTPYVVPIKSLAFEVSCHEQVTSLNESNVERLLDILNGIVNKSSSMVAFLKSVPALNDLIESDVRKISSKRRWRNYYPSKLFRIEDYERFVSEHQLFVVRKVFDEVCNGRRIPDHCRAYTEKFL